MKFKKIHPRNCMSVDLVNDISQKGNFVRQDKLSYTASWMHFRNDYAKTHAEHFPCTLSSSFKPSNLFLAVFQRLLHFQKLDIFSPNRKKTKNQTTTQETRSPFREKKHHQSIYEIRPILNFFSRKQKWPSSIQQPTIFPSTPYIISKGGLPNWIKLRTAYLLKDNKYLKS